MAIVDEKANIVQSYEYSAFGECLSGKDAVNAFRFVGGFGGQTDDATGLVYFWNRWYDPSIGKFMSEDPIRHLGGLNLYRYGSNNPSNRVDWTGLIDSVSERAKHLIATGQTDELAVLLETSWGVESVEAQQIAAQLVRNASVSNTALQNALSQIFRLQDKFAGGTAGMLLRGIAEGSARHLQKALERVKNLQNILCKQELTDAERALAEEVLGGLNAAIDAAHAAGF